MFRRPAALLLIIAALPASGPATPAGDAAPTPSWVPLVRPGRTLHYRARSTVTTSRPDQRPAPQVGFVLSRLEVVNRDESGWLHLRETSTLHAADGQTMDRLGAPQDRRTRDLRVQPEETGGLIAGLPLTLPPESAGRRNQQPLPVAFSDDGFGLNDAARAAVGMPSLLLPPGDFQELAAGRTVQRSFDFWMVREDPLRDRVVVPLAEEAARPAAAESRIRGSLTLRPGNVASHRLLWRRPVPASVPGGLPPRAPDQEIHLEALSVEMTLNLTASRFPRQGPPPPAMRRADRMTWVVLNRAEEPWLLAGDGTIDMTVGEGERAVHREGYLSRSLHQVSSGSP